MKNIIKSIICICFAVLVITSLPAQAKAEEWAYFDEATEKLKQHFIEASGNAYGKSSCISFINALQEDGTFFIDSDNDGVNDLNYNDDPETRVTTLRKHLQITRVLARAANEEGHYLYENPDIAKEAIERALEGWQSVIALPLESDGTITYTSNWWSHTVGQQVNLMPVLVMSEHLLDEEHLEIGLKYLCDHEDMYKYPEYLTGANLTSYTTQGIVDGLLSRDYRKLSNSVERMKEEIQIFNDPTKEGIQQDFSFHQHGSQYLASYGSSFIIDSATYLSIFDDTDLSCSELYELLENRLLDGCRWEKWGKDTSLNLAGRTISDEYAAPSGEDDYVKLCDILLEIYPGGRTDEITAFRDYLNQNTASSPAVIGNKYFWCSDYMIHNKENYSVSYKMVSNRTVVAETNSRDNILGQNVGLGSVFLSKSGDIHHGSQVCWDWSKIPGVTAGEEVDVRTQSGFITQSKKFVGGVSDGSYGATVFDVSLRQTDAKKSMFFFDDEYVSLGCGITSAETGVATTIEQRARQGELYIDGSVVTEKETKVYSGVRSALQNNIGYVFPEAADLTITNDYVTGKWSDLSTSSTNTEEETRDMFVMWIDHGDYPVKQSYSYITIPEISYDSLTEYTEDIPIEIVANNENMQAVYHKKLDIGAVSFYNKGQCILGAVKVTVDKPCILMIKKADEGYEISTANPRAEEMVLNVDVMADEVNYSLTFEHKGSNVGEKELGGTTRTKEIVLQ